MTDRPGFYRRSGKRLLDVVIVMVSLPVTLLLIAVIFVTVRLTIGRPAMFTQERPGLNGTSFRIVKFRTMNNAKDSSGRLLSDQARLTPVGTWLRSASLDELPEIWNVLVGDMSLVGPRPLLTSYLPLYSARQSRRHEVRPGITGLAQIRGRNALTWDEKFEWDVDYVDRCSLRLDLQILWSTVLAVVQRRGVSQPGHATMEEFKGKQ